MCVCVYILFPKGPSREMQKLNIREKLKNSIFCLSRVVVRSLLHDSFL